MNVSKTLVTSNFCRLSIRSVKCSELPGGKTGAEEINQVIFTVTVHACHYSGAKQESAHFHCLGFLCLNPTKLHNQVHLGHRISYGFGRHLLSSDLNPISLSAVTTLSIIWNGQSPNLEAKGNS